MKDYYEILEVSRKASKDTINKVFKMHMKANHPDLFQGEEKIKAEEKSKEFTEAYNVLSDDNSRAKYDEELKQNEQSGGDASMLQTIKEENEYLRQVIAQKNDFIARLTGSYESQTNDSNYYDEEQNYGQATYGHNAQNSDPYAGMTYEQLQQLKQKEKLSYFIARIKSLGSQFFVLAVLGIILIISLISTLKNLGSYFGK